MNAHLASSDWPRLLAGLFVVYGLFQGVAHLLRSDRGEAGLLIAALVTIATLTFQRSFFAPTVADAARAVGLGVPVRRGVAVAAALGLGLLLVIPAYVHVTHASMTFRAGWLSMLPGLFAQAGIAEEVLFRGYVFGNLRRRHAFWRAAWLSMLPFVLVHLSMFATMDWPIASAALLLAVAMSFPLARLFEDAGHTIWAPALLHFIAQATLKVVLVSGPPDLWLPLVWMAACATIPYLVFVVPSRGQRDA